MSHKEFAQITTNRHDFRPGDIIEITHADGRKERVSVRQATSDTVARIGPRRWYDRLVLTWLRWTERKR
jgi:hypothetical protein